MASQRNDALEAFLSHPSLIWDSEKEEPCELVLVWTATQNTQWEQVHRCANTSSS